MKPNDIENARKLLPRDMEFPYYTDRESAWLLANLMPDCAPVPALRKSPLAKLLDRPVMKPLVARSGGQLQRRDILAVAHAQSAQAMDGLTAAGKAGIGSVFAQPWLDFTLSFDSWGLGQRHFDQTTRQEGNLVIQLAFPTGHAALTGRYLPKGARKAHEYDSHPIRRHGRPTLAWARVDIDFAAGEALIEEVQTDWLRIARERVEEIKEQHPRSRRLASAVSYEAGLMALYGRIWPRVMLLATLVVLRDVFAMRRVWMHQPGPGAILKRIGGTPPPRSLYSALPKSMCFAPTRRRPKMLQSMPARITKALPKAGPIFWQLAFDAGD